MYKKLNILILLIVSFICTILTGCRREQPAQPPATQTVNISIVADRDSLPADGVSSLTITAKVTYEDGSPARNLEVRFYTTLGTITARNNMTNQEGVITATLVSGNVAGTAIVTVSCLRNSNSINITFYSVSEDVYIYSLTATPSTIPADGVSQSTIKAVFKYTATNEPVKDIQVNFSATLGSIVPYDTTDFNGEASTILTSEKTRGVSSVKVWYGVVKDSINVVFKLEEGDTIPASVILQSVDPPVIAVKGSGGNETSTIVFQVRDASGQPVGGVHIVDFTIEGGPGGDEYLHPTSTSTESLGIVTTHLNSGTKSGPVKAVARVRGTNIFSAPVEIAIVSGPPDRGHFCISSEKNNLYALWYTGVEDRITAYVGDQCGNPVLDNTVVWFSSACGIIQPGSGTTTKGITSNTLISCAPWPLPADSGLFFVYAYTIDRNNELIKDSVRILWSHDTQLTLSPLSFNIPNGGSQNFIIRLHDLYNNPLTEGTTISIQANKGEILGPSSITIPDTQSRLWTEFHFGLLDERGDTLNPRSCKVTVDVKSPNGDAWIQAYGIIN